MPLSSPVSPRDLGLKEKQFQTLADAQETYNIMVKRLNEVYKYNRRDHDRLTEDIGDVGVSGNDTFKTIAVADQSDVVADASDDTLTLVAGSNITLTTDAGADSVTIESTDTEGVDVDSLTAEEGLTRDVPTGDVTIGIADDGVALKHIANGSSSGQIMQWNGSAWVLIDLDAAIIALLDVCV